MSLSEESPAASYGSFVRAPVVARRHRSTRFVIGSLVASAVVVCLLALSTRSAVQETASVFHYAEDTEIRPAQPIELFSQWTTSDVALGAAAGGLANISCHSVNRLLKAPVFRFVTLWLEKHTGCSGGEFVCDAAFMEAMETRSVWVRGTCGVQPAVYGFHIARPNLNSAGVHNPIKGWKGKHQPVVTPCPSQQTLRDGTIIHRTELEKLECELQLVQVVLVAASLADVAVSAKTLESRQNDILIAPQFVLASVKSLTRLMGIKKPTMQMLAAETVTNVVVPAGHPTSYDFVQTYPYCDSNNIVSQGDCGACYAFTGMKAYSSALCAITAGQINVDISEQQAVSCYDTDGCGGGWATNLFDAMNAQGGWSTRPCLPWVGLDASEDGGVPCSKACTTDTKYEIASYSRIQWASEADDASIEAALVQYGPLWACIRVCPGFYTYSGNGVFSDPYTSDCSDCIHAVTIVGYTPTTWRIANSWGTAWGDAGFGNIAKGATMALELEWTYFVVPKVPSTQCTNPPACLNGGSFDKNCDCQCPAGYGGIDCSTCTLQCQNGGVVSVASCTCTCASGFFGSDCSDQLSLSWSAYDSTALTASFTLTYSLSSFFPPVSGQRSDILQRYSDPSRAVWCSNCNYANLTSASGSATLSGENLKLGFGRPNYEHCYSVLLSRGVNGFGIAITPLRVDFPCLTLLASTTLPGGFCLSGGTPITDEKNPMYAYQCTAPAPLPVVACKDTVHQSTCAYWNSRGYCQTTSIYFPYVSLRCANTCNLTC